MGAGRCSTGSPVDFEGETLCRLDIQEADDWVDLMNGLR